GPASHEKSRAPCAAPNPDHLKSGGLGSPRPQLRGARIALALFFPDPVAPTVKPQDRAVGELVRDLRPLFLAAGAPSRPDGAVLVDVRRRREGPTGLPHQRRDVSR